MASLIISCLAHAAAFGILVKYPELLAPGTHMWIRLPILISTPPDPSWRTVTILGSNKRLEMPSPETLKKALYNWGESAALRTPPPIRVRWGDERPTSTGNTTGPAPEVQPALGTQEPKPVPEVLASSPNPSEGQAGSISGNDPKAESQISASEKKGTIYLPAPAESEPKRIPARIAEQTPERSGDTLTEPRSTAAESRRPDASAQRSEEPKLFKDEQSAIRTEGSGLFDTKGFPLGEYARIIIDRIKGNWFIPSNLRNSHGRSTLIFFIEKDGSVSNLRVVNSSGSQSLDLAALSAVLSSKPLPPLPGGFPGEHVGAKFVFSYNEPQ